MSVGFREIQNFCNIQKNDTSIMGKPEYLVLCLEGCHGAGKSELLECFEQNGFQVAGEAFLDIEPDSCLSPQGLIMETKWVVSYIERLLAHAKRARAHQNDLGSRILITDRSPFSACFYGARGELLEPLIRAQLLELQSAANVRVITVHLDVEPETLWQRIQARLEMEPERRLYREQDRKWMDSCLQFYSTFGWDLSVDNTVECPAPHASLMHRVLRQVCDAWPKVGAECSRRHAAAMAACPELTAEASKAKLTPVTPLGPGNPAAAPSISPTVLNKRVAAGLAWPSSESEGRMT